MKDYLSEIEDILYLIHCFLLRTLALTDMARQFAAHLSTFHVKAALFERTKILILRFLGMSPNCFDETVKAYLDLSFLEWHNSDRIDAHLSCNTILT